MKTGAELITEERLRQIQVEGFTLEHDYHYTDRQLAKAAACYIIAYFHYQVGKIIFAEFIRFTWPWDWKWFKPKTPHGDPKRDLVRAGALVAAEIDRLQEEERQNDLEESWGINEEPGE